MITNTHSWTLMNTHYDQNTHSWTLIMIMNTHSWTLMNTHYDQNTHSRTLMNTHYDHEHSLTNTHYDHEHSLMNTNKHSLWTLTSHHCLQWRHSEQMSFRQLGVHKGSTISIVLYQTEQIINNMPRTKWQFLYTICVSLSVTTKLCTLTL